MNALEHICIFRIGDTRLCVAIDEVQQVVEGLELMPMPLAPDVVRGLINLRGLVVTALDGSMVFDLPPSQEESVTHLVVLSGGQALSLVVDEVIEVADAGGEELVEPPPNLSPATRALTRGVLYHEQSLLLLIDPARVIDRVSKCESKAA